MTGIRIAVAFAAVAAFAVLLLLPDLLGDRQARPIEAVRVDPTPDASARPAPRNRRPAEASRGRSDTRKGPPPSDHAPDQALPVAPAAEVPPEPVDPVATAPAAPSDDDDDDGYADGDDGLAEDDD